MHKASRIELCARRALDDPARAREALAWYADAHDYCERIARTSCLPIGRRSIETVAGVIAATSPMVSWESQLHYTPLLIEAHARHEPLPGPGLK